MTASDISEPARLAYAAGVEPLDFAEAEISSLIMAHFAAAVRATFDPGPHPDLSNAAMSRRIIGLLLGAGWLPPGGLEIPEGEL
jgi:hypothetical protein